MEYQPRYKLYLKTTKEPKNHEFKAFINKMKKLYGDSIGKKGDFSIIDQDGFTKFISDYVDTNYNFVGLRSGSL